MNNQQLLTLLKVIMTIGLCLIGLGVYFHLFSETMHAMGVKGIIISACCVALGMIMSIPTKIYLTFVLMRKDEELHEEQRRLSLQPGSRLNNQ